MGQHLLTCVSLLFKFESHINKAWSWPNLAVPRIRTLAIRQGVRGTCLDVCCPMAPTVAVDLFL